jgi:hypothetical protein
MQIVVAYASSETWGIDSWLYNLPILTHWYIVGLSSEFLLILKTLTVQAPKPKKILHLHFFQSCNMGGHFDWEVFYKVLP